MDKGIIQRGVPASVREHFRTTIRHWRESRQLRQRDMADKFGITVSLYTHWESGLRFPTDEKLIEIAGKLELALEELLGQRAESRIAYVPIIGELNAGRVRGEPADAVKLDPEPTQFKPLAWETFYAYLGNGKNRLMALRVRGDALAPQYRKGDLIFLEETDRRTWDNQVLIKLPDGSFALKQVSRAALRQFYFASLSAQIPPMPAIKGIRQLAIVRGVMGPR